jgi:hypothetical protein
MAKKTSKGEEAEDVDMMNYSVFRNRRELERLCNKLARQVDQYNSFMDWRAVVGGHMLSPPADGRANAPYYVVNQNLSNVIFGDGCWLAAYDHPTFEEGSDDFKALIAGQFTDQGDLTISISPNKKAAVYHQWKHNAYQFGSLTICKPGLLKRGRFHLPTKVLGSVFISVPDGTVAKFQEPSAAAIKAMRKE